MAAVRDLGRNDPWEESLERSLARRNGSRSKARRRRPRRLLTSVVLVLAFALLAGAAAGAGDGGHRSPRRATEKRASVLQTTAASDVSFTHLTPVAPVCKPVPGYSGYVNPLDQATVMAERIDQGVDYAGTGRLVALGPGRVTYVGVGATGWPGAFIEYRLVGGPNRGCYVYYSEGINPSAGLHVGETVSPGQVLAQIIPGWSTGIELGWGAGVSTTTYAAKHGQWNYTRDSDSVASAAGRAFSALIASLGGPPGKAEG